jgi:hypothetical protein
MNRGMMNTHPSGDARTPLKPRSIQLRAIQWRGIGIFCALWLSLFALRSSWTVEDTIVSSTLIPNVLQGNGADFSRTPFGINIEDPNNLCFFKDASGRLLPIHPVGMVVLSAPIQGLVWLGAWISGAPLNVTSPDFLLTRHIVEKLTASFLSALSVVYLYWALVFFVPSGAAIVIAALYAFGSSSLSVLSQGLWPHTGINLILMYLAHFLLRHNAPLTRTQECLFFLALGMLCGVRPTAIPFAAVFALAFVLLFGRPRAASLCTAAVALLPVLLWNVVLFQHIMGGYLHVKNKLVEFQLSECFMRLKLILFSYQRGLLVFNPFLVFMPWAYGALRGLTRQKRVVLAAVGVCIISHYLLCSTNPEWHGGYIFGPRYMLDVLAPSFLLAGIGFYVIQEKVPRLAKVTIAVIALVSITLHLFGVLGDVLPSRELNEVFRKLLVPKERWD